MGFMDLARGQAAIQDAKLDALLVLSPLHFYYATGHSSWFLNLYGAPGYGAAVIPAQAGSPPGALLADVEESPFRATAPEFHHVATYPVWIAYADVPPSNAGSIYTHLAQHSAGQPTVRKGQVDLDAAIDLLIELLTTMGLQHARIGTEVDFAAGYFLERLRAALPACQFVNALPLLQALRAVKSPREAALLQRGTELAEAAIADVTEAIQPGMTAGEIARRYRAAVLSRAVQAGDDALNARITLRVGPNVLRPESSGAYAVRPGDVIFMDCGVDVAGYWADMGRCFVLGRVSAEQKQIYAALRAGFDAACERLHTGNSPRQVFDAGMAAVHDAGLTSYVRGNLGHGIGLHRAPEWPIVSREEPLVLADGHVVSVEFPYYIQGVGAFQLEDTFYLTPSGRTVFNRLSHELVEIG